jgi:hypothetical protein
MIGDGSFGEASFVGSTGSYPQAALAMDPRSIIIDRLVFFLLADFIHCTIHTCTQILHSSCPYMTTSEALPTKFQMSSTRQFGKVSTFKHIATNSQTCLLQQIIDNNLMTHALFFALLNLRITEFRLLVNFLHGHQET